MKKAMKLVWMVLFALPLISLTACGDDDEPAPFKEYGYLIDKTRDKVIEDLPFSVSEEETGALYYWDINTDHVSDLAVLFTFDEYDDKGALVVYNKAVWVSQFVYGLSYQTVYNHLESQYGSGKIMTIPATSEDPEENYFQFEHGGKYIWLYNDMMITYVKKSDWDKLNVKTRGGEDLMRVMVDKARAGR